MYDRALEYEVHRQAERKAARNDTPVEPIKRGDFMTPYELKLAPLPCWRALPRAEVQRRVGRMVAEIETNAAKLREEIGGQIVGMEKIRHQDPLERPAKSKSSPKPPCHAEL